MRSGKVLDLATQAALAANARDVMARRLATAQSLAGDLAYRFQAGESSQSDALAASSDAATAAAALSSAEAQLASARAALAVAVLGRGLGRSCMAASKAADGSATSSCAWNMEAATPAFRAATKVAA